MPDCVVLRILFSPWPHAKVAADIRIATMKAITQKLLTSFDQLPEAEQMEFAVEVLRRLTNRNVHPLSNDDLILNAEEIFLALDAQE